MIQEDVRGEELEAVRDHFQAHAPSKVTFGEDVPAAGSRSRDDVDNDDEKRHQSVKRTETYQDPDGLEEREI